MPKSYQHINKYEKEILELNAQGLTRKEIGAKLGFTKKQAHNFITRYNEKQRNMKAGVVIRAKGRPCKSDNVIPPSIQRLDKLSQMQYVMASKDRYIERLEMENELMRDFLSLTERK